MANDRKSPPDVTEYVEQQGLSGEWHQREPWVLVTLRIDDSVCPPIRRGRVEGPKPWTLECVHLNPKPSLSDSESARAEMPTIPVLACFHAELGWPHDLGYVLDDPFGWQYGNGWDPPRKGGWLMLGAGNGVRIDEHAFGGLDPNPTRTWQIATSPLSTSEWSAGTPMAQNPTGR
jgi:hypothetical protein